MNESYSYWTFGDLFEEQGVPSTLFHGGFGLVTQGCIPKPTFWTFDFYRQLRLDAVCRYRDESCLVLEQDGSFQGIFWNLSGDERRISLSLPVRAGVPCTLLERLIDEEHGNPLKLWHDLGEPASLTDSLLRLLQEAAVPKVSSVRVTPDSDWWSAHFCLRPNAVLFFEWKPCPAFPDTGYQYDAAVLRC